MNARIATMHFAAPFARPMTRAIVGMLVLLAIGLPSRAVGATPPTGKPNVVIILADDQGWGDLSISGNSNLATPNIDSLGKSGVVLDRFYVCPVCSPTRAEFLTGRYHPRGGVFSTSTGGERLNLDEKTIGDTFKAAGYATAIFGKWHNGAQWPYHPNARGFDEFYGFCSGHWATYFDPPLEHNGQRVTGHGYLADDLTDHAMAYMEQRREQPFFCYVALNIPHSPMQVPDRFYAKFADAKLKLRATRPAAEDIQFTRAALAMCEDIDWNVGRILQKLDDLKLADNTILIYFSDNGPNSDRWNGGMKGIKGSTDEGGVRAPFLIRWPGHMPAGTHVPQIAAAIDLLPTLADLAAIAVVGSKPLDGVSLNPLLFGHATNWPDRMIFSHWNGKVSVRTQQYRLDHENQLFDMEADPGQKQDVSTQHPEVAAKLSAASAKWRKELLPGLGKAQRPFPVGYPDFPLTELPARDGVGHGHIERSAKFPNSSYFKNWTSTDDSMTWDVAVETPGKYDVSIYYACPKVDLGSTVELSLGDARLRGTVAEANDPPLIGAEHDRVPRKESYTKDFKPMRLGEIAIKSGRGQLTLRALTIPGHQVMEVQQLVLTLKGAP
jgi:arylsulfatase A-like enzyme